MNRSILAVALLLASGAAHAQSTLLISADAPCRLMVNGVAQGMLAADGVKSVRVGAGDQIVQCAAANGAKVRQVLQVESGVQKVVQLQLAAKANAAASGILTRFQDTGDTVTDRQTGVVWTKRDNGQDVDWNEAMRYCNSLSPGSWSLPTMEELGSLVDRSGNLSDSCGAYTCEVSPLFNLSGPWAWSSEQNGSAEAWGMLLSNGDRVSRSVSYRYSFARALCVRRRS